MQPADVRNVRFRPVRMRQGYDIGEVDEWLDALEQHLGDLHRARDGQGPVPSPLADPSFTPVRLREGYNMQEVDAFIAQARAAVAELWASLSR